MNTVDGYTFHSDESHIHDMQRFGPDSANRNDGRLAKQFVVHNCPRGSVVANEKLVSRIRCDPSIPRMCRCSNKDCFLIDDACCTEIQEPATHEPISCRGPSGDGDCFCKEKCLRGEGEGKKGKKKRVRFDDEVRYYDCDEAFRSLRASDADKLCRCCQRCVQKGEEECVGRPVLMYEIPEPKMEDTSICHRDYVKHQVTPNELPPWHPIMRERWNRMRVPSLAETTYQCDYKPPPVGRKERAPVFLAQEKEEKPDPCEQLAESFRSWKKTSTGDDHIQRVHCEQCCLKPCAKCGLNFHVQPETRDGDQNIVADCCQGDGPQNRTNFGISEIDEGSGSRYWWKRTCCDPEKDRKGVGEDITCPAELVRAAPPEYVTCYQHDFKEPELSKSDVPVEDCKTCGNLKSPHKESQRDLLCTKYPNRSFMTQQVGII